MTSDPDPTHVEPVRLDRRRALRAFDHGLLAGLAVAAVYGVLTYPFELSWGLIAAGFAGGMLIGYAVNRGAWRGEPHIPSRRLQLMAASIGIGTWGLGAAAGYVLTQLLFPGATTPLLERVSFGGFADYFTATYQLHDAAALAAMAFMAWRGAR